MARPEVKLIKEMGYERIDCTCGMAVLPKDPSPEITRIVKKIAIEEGAKFSIIDTSLHPEIISQFDIKELPAVMIGKNTYRIEENTIRSAIRKEKI
ncbi:MAG: hypothetical protein OIN88_10820 [Candidatus Methanoperedens sp.]|nr:hypothetical protein [Candidatus Methanoperedens sp.]MCZ7359625.1 hypothetical protein [Candidatus Methanoperedens sp.]HLB71324.1 hypothetical protein [Candidatus Methanoperedens sp.]